MLPLNIIVSTVKLPLTIATPPSTVKLLSSSSKTCPAVGLIVRAAAAVPWIVPALKVISSTTSCVHGVVVPIAPGASNLAVIFAGVVARFVAVPTTVSESLANSITPATVSDAAIPAIVGLPDTPSPFDTDMPVEAVTEIVLPANTPEPL